MFCKNCGTQLDDNAKFCGACGASLADIQQTPSPQFSEQPAAPQQDFASQQGYAPQQFGSQQQYPAPQQGYAPQQSGAQQQYSAPQQFVSQQQYPAAQQGYAPQFGQQNNAPQNGTQPSAPKKSRAKLFIGIGAGVAVIAIAIAAFFILRNMNLSVKDMEKSFLHDTAESFRKSSSAMKNSGYSVDIEVGDYLAGLAKFADVDISWLDNISLDVASDQSENELGYSAKLSLNDTEIATLIALVEKDDESILVSLDGLSDSIGKVDLKEYLNSPGALINLSELDYDKFADLLEKYYGMLWDLIDSSGKIEKAGGTFKANGVSQNCDTFTVSLSERDLADICKGILKELVDDKDFKEFFISNYDYITPLIGVGTYINAEEVYDEMRDSIKYTIDSYTEYYDELGTETFFTLIDYASGGKIIGRDIIVYDDGDEEFEIMFGYAKDGKNIGIELAVNDETYLSGKGTLSGSVFNGQVSVVYDDTPYVDIDFKDFDVVKNTGRIELSLSKNAWNTLDSNQAVAALLASLTMNFDLKEGETAMDVSYGNESMLKMKVKKSDNGKVSLDRGLPEVDIEEWAGTIDLSELISRLKDAGLPDEYLSYLTAESSASSGFFDH